MADFKEENLDSQESAKSVDSGVEKPQDSAINNDKSRAVSSVGGVEDVDDETNKNKYAYLNDHLYTYVNEILSNTKPEIHEEPPKEDKLKELAAKRAEKRAEEKAKKAAKKAEDEAFAKAHLADFNGHLYNYSEEVRRNFQMHAMTDEEMHAKHHKNEYMHVAPVDVRKENGVIYLTTDDAIDLYKHSVVGPDRQTYLPNTWLDKYHLREEDVKFVNVDGVQVPVEEFKKVAVSNERTEQLKQISEGYDAVVKMNNNGNIYAVQEAETDKIAKNQPVEQINDSNDNLQQKYNELDKKQEEQPVQQPKEEPVDNSVEQPAEETPSVSQEKSVEETNNHDHQENEKEASEVAAPVEEVQTNEPQETVVKEEPVEAAKENNHQEEKACEAAAVEEEKSCEPQKAVEEQQKPLETKNEETVLTPEEVKNDGKNEPEEMAACSKCDSKEESASHSKNDEECENCCHDKKESVLPTGNEQADLILSNDANAIYLSKEESTELNKYLVDANRQIYIVDALDAAVNFGILNGTASGKKLVANGNVYEVCDGDDTFLRAPLGKLDNEYVNDSIFFLPANFTVSVERNINPTLIKMPNFEVEVDNVAFRLDRDVNSSLLIQNVSDYVVNARKFANRTNNKSDLVISANQAKEIALINNDSEVIQQLSDLSVITTGANKKINLIDVINKFCDLAQNSDRALDRRIKKAYAMIRQMLIDGCYYAENKMLVLNYAEVLGFLVFYFDIYLTHVYELANNEADRNLYAMAKDAIANKQNYVASKMAIEGNDYQIAAQYDYVLCDGYLLNIRDEKAVSSKAIDAVLFNRPEFSDAQLANMNPNNFAFLKQISPFIDLPTYYTQIYQDLAKENPEVKCDGECDCCKKEESPAVLEEAHKVDDSKEEVKNNSEAKEVNNGVEEVNKELASENQPVDNVKEIAKVENSKQEVAKAEDKKASDSAENEPKVVKDGVLYLKQKDLAHIYQHSHVVADGTAYLDKLEAEKYGLNNPNVKAISVDGHIIPLSSITKQEMEKDLENEQESIRVAEAKKNKKED